MNARNATTAQILDHLLLLIAVAERRGNHNLACELGSTYCNVMDQDWRGVFAVIDTAEEILRS